MLEGVLAARKRRGTHHLAKAGQPSAVEISDACRGSWSRWRPRPTRLEYAVDHEKHERRRNGSDDGDWLHERAGVKDIPDRR